MTDLRRMRLEVTTEFLQGDTGLPEEKRTW